MSLSGHDHVLLLVLHLVDLLLHILLVAIYRLVRHELLFVQVCVRSRVLLLLLRVALVYKALLSALLVLVHVLILRVATVLARVLHVLVLAIAPGL